MKKGIILALAIVFLFSSSSVVFAMEKLKDGESLSLGAIDATVYKSLIKKDGVVDVDTASEVLTNKEAQSLLKDFQEAVVAALVKRGAKIDPSSPIRTKLAFGYGVGMIMTFAGHIAMFSDQDIKTPFVEALGWEGRAGGVGMLFAPKSFWLQTFRGTMISSSSEKLADATIVELRKKGSIVYPASTPKVVTATESLDLNVTK